MRTRQNDSHCREDVTALLTLSRYSATDLRTFKVKPSLHGLADHLKFAPSILIQLHSQKQCVIKADEQHDGSSLDGDEGRDGSSANGQRVRDLEGDEQRNGSSADGQRSVDDARRESGEC